MAGRCRCCAHPDRAALDEALVTGVPLREIERRWQVSKDSASRHKQHVSPALAAVIEERRSMAGPVSAMSRLEDLYSRASRILDAAEAEGKASLSLQAMDRLQKLVETLARITGELDERPTVQVLNVAASAEWLTMRQAMLEALGPYPDAAHAVSARLLMIEAGS
jgi:hypothetical protein